MKTKQTDLIERLQNPNDHHAWQVKTIQTHFNEKALKVFQLCLDGWSTSDISSHMDIKENTIYQLRRRVKIKIRNELKLISYE